MSKTKILVRINFLLVAILAEAPWTSSRAQNEHHPLTLAADKDSVVRFFFIPPPTLPIFPVRWSFVSSRRATRGGIQLR
jgi:hypothetical protein